MSKIVKFQDKDLGFVYIEVADVAEEAPQVPTGGMIKTSNPTQKVMANLDDALDNIGKLAGKISKAIVNNPLYPDEIECKLSVKFTAEANIVIANAGAEGSLELTFKWNSKQLADRT